MLNFPTVDYEGYGKESTGGAALMWNDQVNILIMSYSLNHIMVNFVDKLDGEHVFIFSIYVTHNMTKGRHDNLYNTLCGRKWFGFVLLT